MKVLLLTTSVNAVSTALHNMLSDRLYIVDIGGADKKEVMIDEAFDTFSPDIIITYRFPYILPESIYSRAVCGAYNIHPSLLPKYRGLNPWHDIFSNKESESGVTLHRLTMDIDQGEILYQKSFFIDSDDTIESARDKADKIAAELAVRLISSI